MSASHRPLANPALVAVDLGAESCRVSLLCWEGQQPRIHLVHRFPTVLRRAADGQKWDLEKILAGVEQGLRMCAEAAPQGVAAIGVDGWAVDYVRLNGQGKPLAGPFCYRDERTREAMAAVHARISPARLYQLTGVQILPLNTLYQLFADNTAGVEPTAPWVNLPEFVLHHWGGRRVSEYTNATHTQLLNVDERGWCKEVFAAAGLALSAAPPVVAPGTDLGLLRGPLASLPAFRATRLIAPACHDTASAIAGIAAQGDDWAFISSGTWSLVGCRLASPCLSPAARETNFSNEGGIGGSINFLKNVNGMWPLQQCLAHWRARGDPRNLNELLQACGELPAPKQLLDVNHPDLLLPDDMPARINAQLRRAGGEPIADGPAAAPQFALLILHSLAAGYARVLQQLAAVTEKKFRRLVVVGGGSRNYLLNFLTEQATGLAVETGSAESATLGNLAVQMAALEGNYDERVGVARDAVAHWVEVLSSQPLELLHAHGVQA
jgi:rhamnulokinase